MLLKNLNIEIPDIPAAAAPAWRNAQRLLREAIDPVRAEPGNEHLGTIELVKIAASRGNEFAAEVVRGLDNPAFQELMRNVASAAAFFGWEEVEPSIFRRPPGAPHRSEGELIAAYHDARRRFA